jgi:hypothetical protein
MNRDNLNPSVGSVEGLSASQRLINMAKSLIRDSGIMLEQG